MELTERELEILIIWGQSIDGEYGLFGDEARLLKRLEDECDG